MSTKISLGEQMRNSQLDKFKLFWKSVLIDGKESHASRQVKSHAESWTGMESAMWGGPCTINALRAAGAYVRIVGVDADGDWAIEVMSWDEFNRDVFEVMGIDDPLIKLREIASG